MRLSLVAVAGIVCAFMVSLHATGQERRPDFTGTWVSDPEKSLTPSNKPRTDTLIVKQTPAEITIELAGSNQPPLVYKLDGTETVVARANWEMRSKAKWVGAALVIETTRTVSSSGSGAVAFYITDTYKLEAPTRLVFERVTKLPRGEQGVTIVYSKKQP
jgi:hypothetical protein